MGYMQTLYQCTQDVDILQLWCHIVLELSCLICLCSEAIGAQRNDTVLYLLRVSMQSGLASNSLYSQGKT